MSLLYGGEPQNAQKYKNTKIQNTKFKIKTHIKTVTLGPAAPYVTIIWGEPQNAKRTKVQNTKIQNIKNTKYKIPDKHRNSAKLP